MWTTARKEKLLEDARLLISGLERISADSIWSHRSSGYRGAMLRILDRIEKDSRPGIPTEDLDNLEQLMQVGHRMLVSAAREIGK